MKLNTPNKLTLARLILVPVFVVIFAVFNTEIWGKIAAAIIFSIASFTDFLDGKIARKNGLITDFGKFLDPLADKFLVITALITLLFVDNSGVYGILLFAATIIVVLRELAVTSMRLVVATSPDKKVIAASIVFLTVQFIYYKKYTIVYFLLQLAVVISILVFSLEFHKDSEIYSVTKYLKLLANQLSSPKK